MVVLNEKSYAERYINEGLEIDNPYFVLNILAKYYYYEYGCRKKELVAVLIDFFSKHYPRYSLNEISWRMTIESLVKNVGKYPLYEISGVKITKSEIETIESIQNKVLERLMFTMLCLAKLNNIRNPKNNGWVNTDIKDIFVYARISVTIEDQDILINKLYKKHLIAFPQRNDVLNIRVLFIDDGEEELFISDFRELGYEYRKYKGEDFERCRECGVLFNHQNKNKTRKYCKDCIGYSPQETKVVTCIDCGKEFAVKALNNKTSRCEDCYDTYRKEYKVQKERERRKKNSENKSSVDSTILG